jgi:hypothetical protein
MSRRFHVDRFGFISGPFEQDEFDAMGAQGAVSPRDAVSVDGGPWIPARQVMRFPGATRAWPAVGAFVLAAALLWASIELQLEILRAGSVAAAWVPLAISIISGVMFVLMMRARTPVDRQKQMLALVALSLVWVIHIQSIRAVAEAIVVDDMGESAISEIAPSTYRYEGWITRRTVRDLMTALGPSGSPVTLEIESQGGNVLGALEAADWIQSRGGVNVRVTGKCASACAPLAAAGARLEMAPGALIGVHRLRTLGTVDTTDLTEPYISRMIKLGYRNEVINAIRTVPSESVKYFSPVVHAEHLPPVLLIDGAGQPMSLEDARLQWFSGLLRQDIHRHADAAADLFELVSTGFREQAIGVATTAAQQSAGGNKTLAQDMAAFWQFVTLDSMRMASSQVLRDMTQARVRHAKAAVQAGDWESCYIDDVEWNLATRTAIMQSAAANGWKRSPPLSQARLDALVERALRSPHMQNVTEEAIDSDDPRAMCLFTLAIMEVALSLRDAELPAVVARISEE